MSILEKLTQLASDEGIIIDYAEELPNGLEGLYIYLEGIGHIIALLNNIKEDKDKHIEVLSEELGHYFTSYGDNVMQVKNYREYLDICKSEKKALDWGVNYLISLSDLERAFKNNCRNYYEIADFLGVPEKLVRDKFKYLSAKNEKIITTGEYSIILTNYPTVMVYKDVK